MKKLLCLMLCLMMPFAALAEADNPLSADDFALTVNDTVYNLAYGLNAAELVGVLESHTGAPLAMTETISCMFSGMDREYANDAVVLGTYPIGTDGGDLVESIIVLSDAFITDRGAMVGMSKAEVEALYGTDYVLDWDQMIYSLGEMEPQLIFVIDLNTNVVTSWMMLRNTVV